MFSFVLSDLLEQQLYNTHTPPQLMFKLFRFDPVRLGSAYYLAIGADRPQTSTAKLLVGWLVSKFRFGNFKAAGDIDPLIMRNLRAVYSR